MELVFRCTKGTAKRFGFSASYLEKGRIYGYGPAYRRAGRKVLYRDDEVQAWLDAHRTDPEAHAGGDSR